MFKTNIFFNFGVSFFYIFLRKIFWRRKVSWECTPECSKLSWRFSRLPGGSATLVGQWQERIKLSCQRLNRRFQRKQETSLTVSFSHRKLTVAQKCHDDSIFLTAISICSRQFQFTHGNFNYLCSRLVQFTHGNFNFLTANNAHGIFRFAHHVKRQNQKSIFKVDLQSEKWKSKIESRFTNTYASRQWVDNRRVYWSQKIIKNYLTLTWSAP